MKLLEIIQSERASKLEKWEGTNGQSKANLASLPSLYIPNISVWLCILSQTFPSSD